MLYFGAGQEEPGDFLRATVIASSLSAEGPTKGVSTGHFYFEIK